MAAESTSWDRSHQGTHMAFCLHMLSLRCLLGVHVEVNSQQLDEQT